MNVLHTADLVPLPEGARLPVVAGEVEPFIHIWKPLPKPTLPPEPAMLGNESEDHAKILNGVEEN